MDMALYCRADGLLEPRAQKAVDWVKSQRPGQVIIAEVLQDVRSSLQNRYLNGWVYTKQIADQLRDSGQTLNGIPWTRDSIHAAMQDCFLVKQEFLLKGRHHKVYESTATMSKKRFTDYIDNQIKPFWLEGFGIHIMSPQEGYWWEIYNEVFNSGRDHAA